MKIRLTMNKYTPIWCILVCLCTVQCQSFRPSFLDRYLGIYREFHTGWSRSIGHISTDPVHMQKARKLGIMQKQYPTSYPFPCNVSAFRSLKPPSNINEVRPGDIDIVAALGDSLTAGNGLVATNLYHVYLENRGLAWSIGGQGTWREYITLPNILKEFNPNLFGFSTGDSTTLDRESQFNPAEAGALSSELPYMAQILVKRIKSDPRVNLEQHWKLVTILIGDNDFCLDICFKDDLKLVLEQHRKDYIKVLRTLRDNLPRTIVNIVPPANVKILKDVKGKPISCNIAQITVECYCFFSNNYKGKLDIFYELIKQWIQIDKEVASMDEFHTDNFTVVYQPFILAAYVSKISENLSDLSSLSTDCFHLSQRLQAKAATSLWNNMLERIGNKSEKLFDPLDLRCPTNKDPFIFTAGNSYN